MAKGGPARCAEEEARLGLCARLRAAGLAPSRVRLCVLQALSGEGLPARHGGEDVYRLLSGQGTAVSLSTVYRVLKDFERVGLVAQEWRRHRGSMRAMFRLRGPGGDQGLVALACCHCGARVQLRDTGLFQQLMALARAHGLASTGAVSVQIDGWRAAGEGGAAAPGCAGCQEANPAARSPRVRRRGGGAPDKSRLAALNLAP